MWPPHIKLPPQLTKHCLALLPHHSPTPQVAAKVTVTAATTAVKVAAPVGQWAIKEGFKAAVGLVSYAMEQERLNKSQQKQQGKRK